MFIEEYGKEYGGTLKAEIIRTAELLEEIMSEPYPLYFLVAYLHDSQYRYDDKRYSLLLEELRKKGV